jgi:hypothetical protein
MFQSVYSFWNVLGIVDERRKVTEEKEENTSPKKRWCVVRDAYQYFEDCKEAVVWAK